MQQPCKNEDPGDDALIVRQENFLLSDLKIWSHPIPIGSLGLLIKLNPAMLVLWKWGSTADMKNIPIKFVTSNVTKIRKGRSTSW